MANKHITFTAGGKQYRAKSGDSVLVERMEAAVGDAVQLSDVILIEKEEGGVVIGDALAKASVSATVTEHLRAPKLRVFKMRRRKSSRRTNGHRQNLTRLTIGDVQGVSA